MARRVVVFFPGDTAREVLPLTCKCAQRPALSAVLLYVCVYVRACVRACVRELCSAVVALSSEIAVHLQSACLLYSRHVAGCGNWLASKPTRLSGCLATHTLSLTLSLSHPSPDW
ncbi:hypothetical protein K431DRAFT_80906 [Polychaeton citri CBS 116435]|uniref:Uncharacterized protein n=1 Tax=Polychaeton citri CBS 116435 TaxID=1314669 RepID=A0A9P4QG38_9PEZI|nr:hypothetical protein K431DRAFT_80906 [Polychaeton citri CBS 116435]